jgi:hypothetical protein
VFSTIATTTEIGYLSGVTNSIQVQIDAKANTSALANYLPLSGGTCTGTVYNTGGSFYPYKGGDVNRGVYLFANNADGATYSTYNGGLGSWYGIGFYCSNDSTTRFVFNTRNGNSSQTGKITCAGLESSANIITSVGSYVGIGSSSPRVPLDVNGDIVTAWNNSMIGTMYLTGNAYFLGLKTNISQRLTKITSLAGDDTGGVSINTGQFETEQMRVTAGGVVGIGDATPNLNWAGGAIPNAKLTIRNGAAGGVNGKSRISLGANSLHYSAIEAEHIGSGSTTLSFMTTESAFVNGSNPYTRMFINELGKVGIGTVSPSYQLSVQGDSSASGSLIFGSGGTYTPGCIYSDSSWGMICRAKTSSPAIARFLWSDASDIHQMVISKYGVLGFSGGGAGISTIENGTTSRTGSVVIGATDTNYDNGWNTGLLLQCYDTTGISVHDSGVKLASFMYYSNNCFYMGMDPGSGWGTTPIQINSNLYYSSPPLQSVAPTADGGLVLGWDYSNGRVTRNQIEAYHSGPYNNYIQGNWNGMNRTYQFYKESYYSGIMITGYATQYLTSGGFQDIQIRLYNQSTGQYFYYSSYIFYNATYNHQPIPININPGALPSGWYDVYTYILGSNIGIDGNDVLSLTYTILPVIITSG